MATIKTFRGETPLDNAEKRDCLNQTDDTLFLFKKPKGLETFKVTFTPLIFEAGSKTPYSLSPCCTVAISVGKIRKSFLASIPLQTYFQEAIVRYFASRDGTFAQKENLLNPSCSEMTSEKVGLLFQSLKEHLKGTFTNLPNQVEITTTCTFQDKTLNTTQSQRLLLSEVGPDRSFSHMVFQPAHREKPFELARQPIQEKPPPPPKQKFCCKIAMFPIQTSSYTHLVCQVAGQTFEQSIEQATLKNAQEKRVSFHTFTTSDRTPTFRFFLKKRDEEGFTTHKIAKLEVSYFPNKFSKGIPSGYCPEFTLGHEGLTLQNVPIREEPTQLVAAFTPKTRSNDFETVLYDSVTANDSK